MTVKELKKFLSTVPDDAYVSANYLLFDLNTKRPILKLNVRITDLAHEVVEGEDVLFIECLHATGPIAQVKNHHIE